MAYAILNSKSPRKALELFDIESKRVHPKRNPELCSAILHYLAGAQLYVKANCLMKDFIEELRKFSKQKGVCHLVFNALSRVESSRFSPDVFGVLIVVLSEMALVDEALWVYQEIGELVSLRVGNAILDGLVKKGRFDSMWEVYREMGSRGFCPDVITYGVLINGCCRKGDLLKALEVFDEMRGRGIEATVVIYTTIIRGLCNQGKMVEAEGVFRKMKEAGVLPNLYTYNSLMDGYCKSGNAKQALVFYYQMLDHGLKPDVVTFGILINALSELGELIAARSFFVHMAKFGVFPNVFVYNYLIKSFCKAGKLSEVKDLTLEMKKYGISLDMELFMSTFLLNVHVRYLAFPICIWRCSVLFRVMLLFSD